MTLLLTLFLSIQAHAFTYAGDLECNRSDSKIDVYVSKDRFEPRVIYVKENDKVCLKVHAVDYGASFTIDGYPAVLASVRANSPPRISYFTANKVGEFKINCKGGCALGVNAKLVVQSKESFEREEERKYRKDARDYRKNDPYNFDRRSVRD